MENEKAQEFSTHTVSSPVVYPGLVYVVGGLVILGGFLGILLASFVQYVPGIIGGIYSYGYSSYI